MTLWIAAMIVAAFLFVEPALGFPGQTSRIMFFHIPQAWVASLSFLLSMIAGCLYLIKREIRLDQLAFSAAELGFLFCLLATASGSMFAKATWGSFWNWDPRETSILILLMIYGAYFALRSAIAEQDKKRAFSAVYLILAFVTVPFLIFVVPRITFSLHPEDTMNPMSPGMDIRTLLVFSGSLFAYTALFIWILSLRMRILCLQQMREDLVLNKEVQ
ncbi:MAG: cytochrome c biogenesis protein CcsA [Deltaproteobacteria bacterium]|nr:cytochrome c biogenesis protein CcsA [Deltaproteobacteria bacterium]